MALVLRSLEPQEWKSLARLPLIGNALAQCRDVLEHLSGAAAQIDARWEIRVPVLEIRVEIIRFELGSLGADTDNAWIDHRQGSQLPHGFFAAGFALELELSCPVGRGVENRRVTAPGDDRVRALPNLVDAFRPVEGLIRIGRLNAAGVIEPPQPQDRAGESGLELRWSIHLRVGGAALGTARRMDFTRLPDRMQGAPPFR